MASIKTVGSLMGKSLAPGHAADTPFLKPGVVPPASSGNLGSDTSSDESWTDEPLSFEPLPTRSRAVSVYSTTKRGLTRKRINNPRNQVGMQCMMGEDGKYYYVAIDPYNAEHLKIIDALSPLLVNPMPSEFQKGALYTYIIASIITKNAGTGADVQLVPPKLYACQAQNIFEFGTKHHHIFFRMALTNELARVALDNGIDANKVEYGLHASGEIKCIKPRNLMVNFFSGTYKMKRKIPENRVSFEINFIKKLMCSIDRNYKIKYNPAPFITSDSVPITLRQLEFLQSQGIPVFPFNTKEQCHDMKIHIMRAKYNEKKTLGLEEMKQKYEQIQNPPPAPPPTNAYILSTEQLKTYAQEHKHEVQVPEPYDKLEMRRRVQEHMDKNKGANMGNGGGKKRTLRNKRTQRNKITLKKR